MTEWKSHAKLGLMALRALPRRERTILASLPAQGPELKLLPFCSGLHHQLAGACLMMDWVYDDDYRKYTLQPDGKLLPHMLPDDQGKGAFFSGNAPSPGKFALLLNFLMERTLSAWQNKEYTLFARYGGILGHFLQDVTAPTHTLNGNLRNALFPDPVPGKRRSVSSFCYLIADEIPMEEVSCAGATLAEAVFTLTHEAFLAADRARTVLPELLHGAYAEDTARCQQLLTGPAKDAAVLTARAWLSILRIAEKNSSALPVPFPLTAIRPLYHHPDIYASFPLNTYCLNGHDRPMTLLSPSGEIPCSNAFAMTGHSGMKFFTNQLFSTLEFTLGLAPFPGSQDNRMNVTFCIETAPEWDMTFSEDMEYGTTPVLEIPMGPSFVPGRYKVNIRDAATLAFTAKAAPHRTAEGGIDFVIPHLGIEDAVLY